MSLLVDTKGTGVAPDDVLAAAVTKLFDLRPDAIIRRLNLRQPIYHKACNYGHFGKEGLSWEAVDAADALRREVLGA